MLEVRDLYVNFGETVAVKQVSFSVKPGEIVGLIGESGSGKSVSALSVMGLLSSEAGVSGKILFQGKNLLQMSPEERRLTQGRDMTMVFQEPMTSLNPLLKIEAQLEEMLLLHTDLDGVQRRERILETMEAAGLQEPETLLNCYPHELSGGMRQRVMIAMALLCNPALMIADEPTTALDAKLQEQILVLLRELSEKRNMAILFISHNMSIVRNFCERIYVMQKGQIVESGTPEEIFDHPEEPYTQELIASIPTGAPRTDTCPVENPAVLEVKDFSVYYPKKRKHFWDKRELEEIVKSVSFQIRRGELVGLVGRSGCGKSTLSNGILGFQKYTKGEVQHGTERPQMVFQDPYSSLNPKKTIGWILREPLRPLKLPREEQDKRVTDILDKVGLAPEVAKMYPHELSGGMRQRVSIAIALIQGSDFLIADEPVSALDVTIQKQILELFLNVQRRTGLACLFISHDMNVVKQMCHRVLKMQDGTLQEVEL